MPGMALTWTSGRGGGGGALQRVQSEAVVPKSESMDLPRDLSPITVGALQALQPLGRGKVGVDVPPPEHRGPKVGRIHSREGHRPQVVFSPTRHRMGAELV